MLGETHNSEYLQTFALYGGRSVMVRGCISASGVGFCQN